MGLGPVVKAQAMSCLGKSQAYYPLVLEIFSWFREEGRRGTDSTVKRVEEENTVLFDKYTYGYALTACETGKDWRRAQDLLKLMEIDHVEVDTVLLNMVISVYGASGEVDLAVGLFNAMRRGDYGSKATPNLVAYCKVIQACTAPKDGEVRWKEALSFYQQAQMLETSVAKEKGTDEEDGGSEEGEEEETALFANDLTQCCISPCVA